MIEELMVFKVGLASLFHINLDWLVFIWLRLWSSDQNIYRDFVQICGLGVFAFCENTNG